MGLAVCCLQLLASYPCFSLGRDLCSVEEVSDVAFLGLHYHSCCEEIGHVDENCAA